jgi:hypothetical protein
MPFRYVRDPLFLACVVTYFANRWLIKPLVAGGFVHDHLNDSICIPLFLPIMLFALRQLGLRQVDGPPSASEILIPVVLWSLFFEVVLPAHSRIGRGMTADYRDIFYYALSGLISAWFWAVWYGGRSERRRSDGSLSVSRVGPLPPQREEG